MPHKQDPPDMSGEYAALIVRVPDEYFPDDDDICLTAGNFVCGKLERHLLVHGHRIPNWIKGGCDEDWGVYYESQYETQTFQYHIGFFPPPPGDESEYMVVQYHLKVPLLKRLFAKPPGIGANDPIHRTMQEFGKLFDCQRMLTQEQLDREL